MATEREITPALLREAAVRDICEALGICVSDEGTVELREFLRAVADAWEGGWMERPVGADGRPVRIGEEVSVDGEGPFMVEGLAIGTNDGWDVMYETDESYCAVLVSHVTHDRPDSWERVLRDAMALGFRDGGTEADLSDLVGRCERLAGEVA